MEDLKSNSNSRTGKGGLYYGWVMLAICLILMTISYGIRFSFGVFFKSLEQEFEWSRALTSSVFSVYMLLGSLFAVLGGWLADRYGPRIIFMTLGLFCFLGLALTSQSSAPWHLFLGHGLLVAIGTGPVYSIASSIATRWFPQRRGLALGIVTSGVGLGSILVAPIAAYLIVDYGWRISYLTIGVMALMVMTPLSLLLRKNPTKALSLYNNVQQAAVSLHTSNTSGEESRELSIGQIIKQKNFVLIISIWFFWAFCLFMVTTHIVRHAIDLNIDPMQAASIVSVSGFANVPARITMGLVSDRFGRKRIALICASLMAISMLWLTQSSSLWMFFVFAIVFGAAYGGLTPSTTALVSDTFGVHHAGLVFGLLEIGWVCGAAVGPTLAGYIFDVTSQYYYAFLLGTLAPMIMVVLVFFLRVPIPKNKK